MMKKPTKRKLKKTESIPTNVQSNISCQQILKSKYDLLKTAFEMLLTSAKAQGFKIGDGENFIVKLMLEKRKGK